MCEHADQFLDVLKFLFGDCYTFVSLFDWSSGHAKYLEGALNVNVMHRNYKCKQETMQNYNQLSTSES